MILANAGSTVQLYHDNAVKLATTATGIDVTGTVVADGLTVNGGNIDGTVIGGTTAAAGSFTSLQFDGLNPTVTYDFNDSGTVTSADALAYIKLGSGISTGVDISSTPVVAPNWSAATGSVYADNKFRILAAKGNSTDALAVASSNSALGYGDTVVIGNVDVNGSDTKLITGLGIDGELITLAGNVTATGTLSVAGEITANGGIDVTGTATMDGLTVAGLIEVDGSANGNVSKIALTRTDASWSINNETNFRIYGTTGDTTSPATKRFEIGTGGDISFYEDTGTTPKFFWDASAESLGIGTDSPSEKLELIHNGANRVRFSLNDTGNNLQFWNDNTPTFAAAIGTGNPTSTLSGTDGLKFDIYNGSWSEAMRIDSSGKVGIGTSSPATKFHVYGGNSGSGVDVATFRSASGAFNIKCSDLSAANPTWTLRTFSGEPLAFGQGTDERMRIDSSGNLLVGKTGLDVGVVGQELRSSGYMAATRDGATVGSYTRLNSDGTILEFRKDGTAVGSIGVKDGYLTAGNADAGLLFLGSGVKRIQPWSVSSNSGADNQIDLGYSTERFKDLYLSGGVYLGGTGAANKLEDYEEGTWAVAVFDASSGGNESATAVNGYYTKIGNLVHCNFIMNNIDTSGLTGANPIYWSLPFGVASTENALGQVTGNFNNGSIVQVHPYAAQNSGRIFLLTHKDNGNEGFIVVSDFSDDSDDVIISLSYRTS